jgi:D-alanyl-D-alanine carboxypeptidase/D-alanyl-D-alanine-endopeptidase (penicillin-binding protein 4)
MKHVALVVLTLILLSFCAPLQAGLSEDIRAMIQEKPFAKAEMGVQVVQLGAKPGESKILFRHNSDIPFMPASNLKLVTTSAALEKLGPDFKFRTVLARRGNDLILIGDGDPSFGDGDVMKAAGWEITTVFKQWVDLLKKQNFTNIENVIVDDSIFDQTFYHPNWDPKQYLEGYRAEVAGMNLNLNLLDFYVRVTSVGEDVDYSLDPPTHYISLVNKCLTGNDSAVWFSRDQESNNFTMRGEAARSNTTDPISVPIHDPPLYAACVLAELCKSGGIGISGKVSRDRTLRQNVGKDATIQTLAVYETPLENILARANKDSVNLYAECLCKRLGAATTGESGSWENGIAAMRDFLTKSVGVDQDEFSFDDGCGLSRKNGVSANVLCRVLEHDWYGVNRDAFFASMAIGGVDGKTLKKRFTDDLKGRVFAKTGYIRGVSCLSGFLKTRDDTTLAFSVLINDIYTDDARRLQERIVKAVDRNAAVRSSSISP